MVFCQKLFFRLWVVLVISLFAVVTLAREAATEPKPIQVTYVDGKTLSLATETGNGFPQ